MAENKKLLSDNTQLMLEWDWDKNNELKLDPTRLFAFSNKKVWWKCQNNHSWKSAIDQRSSGTQCPYCSNRRVLIGYNDLSTTAPEFLKEWNYEKNTNISPLELTSGSSKIVWWRCFECGYEWRTSIRHRTERNSKCPECAKKQRAESRIKTFVNKNGCIVDELLLKEWNYQRNGDKIPEQFAHSSNQKVWWICHKCGYEWEAKISNRHFGRGCPCCSNKVVVKGKNDLLTTNPELAKEWHDVKNIPLTREDVTIGSGKKVWWICQNGHEYQASVMHRGHGTNCPICNSGRQTSFAEQAIYYYVKQIFPDAINRAKKILDGKMELDIYVPSIKLAIEYDGSFWHNNKKSKLREEEKYKKCFDKGIYLIRIREVKDKQPKEPLDLFGKAIDHSDIKAKSIFYIYENAKRNDLDNLIKAIVNKIDPQCNLLLGKYPILLESPINIDTKRDEHLIRSYMKDIIGDKALSISHPKLAKEWHPTKNGGLLPDMFSSTNTYRAWWLCSVCGNEWTSSIRRRVVGTGCKKCHLNKLKENHPSSKRIYQYTTNGVFIKEWESISKAGRELNIVSSNISRCAKHQNKTTGGYRWEYFYCDELEPIVKIHSNRKSANNKSIIQIDDLGNVIEEFPSLKVASQKLRIDATCISKALNGRIKHAGGFCWKFKV